MPDNCGFRTIKNKFLLVLSVAMLSLVPLVTQADFNPQRMGFSDRYPIGYSNWPNAFLAGNGKMGIMVLGIPLNEVVIYNDRGFNLPRREPRSFAQVSNADLETIKSDCANGDFAAANKLAVSNYLRTCNFRTGEITVKWTDDRGDWERKSFVSRKDNVDVQLLTAPTRGKLNCSIKLGTDPGMGLPKEVVFTQSFDADFFNIRAKYWPDADIGYEGVTRYVVTGGNHSVDGNVLNVTNATSVMLLTRTAKYRDHCGSQWNQKIIQKDLADVVDVDAMRRQTHPAFARVACGLDGGFQTSCALSDNRGGSR